MSEPLRLMAITAHPDDESLGFGGVLARYQAEGVETSLTVATLGERGWQGPEDEYPGLQGLGEIRKRELQAAADVLGIKDLELLGYTDGDLDQAAASEIVPQIAAHIRRIRPDVIVTFPLDGAYGHPDHIAISQFALSAVVQAASQNGQPHDLPAHQVQKFYYSVWDRDLMEIYESIFGKLTFEVDGILRNSVPWETWSITTWIDTQEYWSTAIQAVACHQSQIQTVPGILRLEPEIHQKLWGTYQFVRAFSLVNGGRSQETDLFEGLR